MSTPCMADRLQKLRDLRKKLCDKETNWKEAFEARDWIVDQLKNLHTMSETETCTKEDIKERIADIICVFEPNDGDNDDR